MSMPGQTIGVGAFTEKLLAVLPLDRTQLSLCYLCGTVAGGLLLPGVGRVYDKIGVRPIVVIVSLAFGASLIFMSRCDQLIMWVCGVERDAFVPDALSGVQMMTVLAFMSLGFFGIRFLGQGCLTMISRSMLMKWFNYRRGLVSAISGVFVAAFFSLSPRLLKWMIDCIGWRGAWFWLGVSQLTVMLMVGWLLFRDNPEECGLEMDGGWKPSERKKVNDESVVHHQFTRREAIGTFAFWVVALTMSLQAMTFTAFIFHLEYVGRANGIEREIFTIFIPLSIVGTALNFGIGSISHRLRLKVVLQILLVAMSIYPMLINSLDSVWGLWGCILGLGIVNGCWSLTMTLAWPRYFGRANIGAISGVCMSCTVILSAIGPSLYSLSLDLTGMMAPAMIISSFASCILLIASLWLVNPQLEYAPERQPST